MILGINATANPIYYAAFSDTFSVKYAWDGLGKIELLSQRLSDVLKDYNQLDGLFTILGPGNYTGIRLALTTMKMLSKITGAPLYGMSLFEAYMGMVFKNELSILTSPSRKGWLNAQVFQSTSSSSLPISSMNQIQVSAFDHWISSFEAPVYWGHFGDLTHTTKCIPDYISLDILAVLECYSEKIRNTVQTERFSPIYSYPAVR
jgi:tRNA A37 threonylcarbamoyladenosine modification protein TsaB